MALDRTWTKGFGKRAARGGHYADGQRLAATTAKGEGRGVPADIMREEGKSGNICRSESVVCMWVAGI